MNVFPLQNTNVTLRRYSGEKVPVLWKISAPVKYSSNDEKVLDVIVVEGNRPALFGRDWLSKLRLDWASIFKVTADIENKCSFHKSEMFSPQFNALLEDNKWAGTLTLEPDVKPEFQKDRPVPYLLVSLFVDQALSSEQVLVHYGPKKPIMLSVDASPYGIGAVLSHKLENGSEKPIECASRTLSEAERNYPK